MLVTGHLNLEATVNGKKVTRRYTPVSPINQQGSVTFVIKTYPVSAEFPTGGLFT